MDALGRYALSVISAGILVSIFCSFFEAKSPTGALCRMIGGVFLAVMIFSPVANWDFEMVATFARSIEIMADAQCSEGTGSADAAMRDIIKRDTAAYILDKASDLGADIAVAVTLNEGELPVPESVTVTGNVSPYARLRLQHLIETDLGITKEYQLWTTQQSSSD